METKLRTLGVLHAKSFSVELDEVARNNAGPTTRRLVIRHPSAVVILPFITPDEVLLVRQYRYAMAADTTEFPAGKLDPGETPEEAAHRELLEETGYRAGRFKKLSTFAPSVGYSTERIHIFAARDLTASGRTPDANEIARVDRVALSRVKEMAVSGDIIDGTTLLALAAYEWLESERDQ